MSFSLDARLSRDTDFVGDLPLCRVLLMNDSRWPWLVLVPRRDNLVELTDLEAPERGRLIEEVAQTAEWLKGYQAEKVNVGALGNIVRQLHVHVVARSAGDPGWPGPVWGYGAPLPYEDAEAKALIEEARQGLTPSLRGAIPGSKSPERRRFHGRG